MRALPAARASGPRPGAVALTALGAAWAFGQVGCRCDPAPTCVPGLGTPVTYVDENDLCDGITPAAGTPALELELVVSGLDSPVWIGSPPGDVERLFIVEQPGTVRIVRAGVLLETPFLDLSGRVSCCGEQGLLSIAFHPDYADNGRFFVDYTNNAGNTVVSELTACSDPDVADATTERELLVVNQPFDNHNGGQLQFGPDGMLYIALGDGGSGGDPDERAQDLGDLLGKILRVDVDGGGPEPYVVPPDNPFVGTAGAQPEIWIYGVRNPWRFSFDRATGDLYIGDVGQGLWEEVDYFAAGPGDEPPGRGANLGWDDCEGPAPFEATCTSSVPPVLFYDHAQGCSVTGGFVYRGCAMPGWQGTYLYSDYCFGFLRSFVMSGGVLSAEMDLTFDVAIGGTIGLVSTFGEDARGEIYVTDYSTGSVYRLVAE